MDGTNFGTNQEIYRRATSWVPLTNYRWDGEVDNDGTPDWVQLSWETPFFSECNFYDLWSDSQNGNNGIVDDYGTPLNISDLVYSIEFKKVKVVNRPEFDGKCNHLRRLWVAVGESRRL